MMLSVGCACYSRGSPCLLEARMVYCNAATQLPTRPPGRCYIWYSRCSGGYALLMVFRTYATSTVNTGYVKCVSHVFGSNDIESLHTSAWNSCPMQHSENNSNTEKPCEATGLAGGIPTYIQQSDRCSARQDRQTTATLQNPTRPT